jgi:hypothetical protein
VRDEHIRNLLKKGKIKLMDGEKRPETPTEFRNKKPEARQMLSINPKKLQILTHIECNYL